MKLDKRCINFFLICGGILCLTNMVFFFVHFNDLVIDVKDTGNIMLTIIGFLFAFAAINIYSIFNTNIDTEKDRINSLTEQYSGLLQEDRAQLRLAQNATRFQMYIHAIAAAETFNSQYLEWIQKATKLARGFVASLNTLHGKVSKKDFDDFQWDVLSIVRDGKYLLEEKKKDLVKDSFWDGHRDKAEGPCREAFDVLSKALQYFENYDFDNNRSFDDTGFPQPVDQLTTQEENKPENFRQKAGSFIKGIFRKKRNE